MSEAINVDNELVIPIVPERPMRTVNLHDAAIVKRMEEEAEEAIEERKRLMAPPGALDLPALVEEARIKYSLPDTFFAGGASYDSVVLYQVPLYLDHYGRSDLYMPDSTKDILRSEASRAVILDAGLLALDSLRSNGIDLGHIVCFTRFSPCRPVVDVIKGKELRVVVVHAGDIRWSETLRAEVRAGKKKVVRRLIEKTWRHIYVDTTTNEEWVPEMAYSSDNYGG